jgi:hypothetical protein
VAAISLAPATQGVSAAGQPDKHQADIYRPFFLDDERAFSFLSLLACLPSAVRVALGSLAIVRFFLAAAATGPDVRVAFPAGLAFCGQDLYGADMNNMKIRKIDPGGESTAN